MNLVPRVLESQFTIDNLQFVPEYTQKNSTEFKNMARMLEEEIKHALFPENTLNDPNLGIEVKVLEFMYVD